MTSVCQDERNWLYRSILILKIKGVKYTSTSQYLFVLLYPHVTLFVRIIGADQVDLMQTFIFLLDSTLPKHNGVTSNSISS